MGAFISEEIRKSYKFYGTGETFLFSFYNTKTINIFNTTLENDYYCYSDHDIISFGCSDGYFSLSIQNNFDIGFTHTTSTFNNLPLINDKNNFSIKACELWALE